MSAGDLLQCLDVLDAPAPDERPARGPAERGVTPHPERVQDSLPERGVGAPNATFSRGDLDRAVSATSNHFETPEKS